jgi:tricorn protease
MNDVRVAGIRSAGAALRVRSGNALLACLLVSVTSVFATDAAAQTRFLRQPSVSATEIAFVHANDIWVVGRDGGAARRLTTNEGAETEPAFSPDGQWLAFTGQYDGNQDVYLVPATGGQPQRLTWHPSADAVQGWTSDGDILFRSGREAVPTRLWKFFSVSRQGGYPEALPVHQAYQGEMSEDGSMLAYQEIQLWDPGWRNYRGGQAQPVRVVSLPSLDLQTPSWEGERHLDPSWMDGSVYYMSERDYASNVWMYDPATGQDRQLTQHADFDVMSLDAGHGVVVYEQAGYLHEWDAGTGATRQLDIQAAGDQNWARSRWEDVGGNQLTNARLSPTGKRALFQHRGDIFTVPVEQGSWRNLTQSPGVADRHPVWSPDGEQIAWFNDESGEYGLVIADQDGGNARRIEIYEPSFYFLPTWSPDGSKLAFTDTHYRVLVMDVASGDIDHVDTDRYAHPERTMNPEWSPDSRFITYARRLDTQLRVVVVHDTETGETHQLTDGMADAISPVWDASGDYLYFLASTNYGLNTGWLDMTSFDHPVTRALYVAILDADGASPFLPRSDEEGTGEATDAHTAEEDGDTPDAPAVTLDVVGIESRIVAAPDLPLRNYTGLVAGPAGQVFVSERVLNEPGATLHRYSLEDREPMEYASAIVSATVSNDRKKLLMRSGSSWTVTNTAGGAPIASDGHLALGGMRIRIEPQDEWGQMLRDGWRFMRDFLYVDNQHGAPWDDVWQWYSDWLPDVEHRSDFGQLLDMVSAEIAVGHSYVRGGDFPDLTSPRTGLLGADIIASNGGYQISRIYTGENWNPGLTGPLAHAGLGVSEGDYIVAVEGQVLSAPTNPFELLEGTAGRTVRISVNSSPSVEGAREITVEPTGDEGQLRSWAWVEDNRRKVEEMSDGQLAYVWLPNTGCISRSRTGRVRS